MTRRIQVRHPNNEPPERLKRVIMGVIQFIVGALGLVAIITIVHYATDPRVLMFDFLFR